MIQKFSTSQAQHVYEVLDYLTIRGQSYIETGVTVDSTTIAEMKVQMVNSGSGQRIFSTYDSAWNSPGTWGLSVENYFYLVIFPLGYRGNIKTTYNVNTNVCYYRLEAAGHCYVYDQTYTELFHYDCTSQTDTSVVSQYGIRMFAFGASHEYMPIGSNVYGFKIWKNNVLVRDYIPVKRLSDNMIGMYDNVNKTFSTHEANQYDFGGTSKSTPEYIDEQRAGTIYVNDIKFNGNSINRIYNNGVVYWGNIQPQYLIHGTTTASSNFNIKLNEQNVQVTVDPNTGEFYLETWTGTLTNLHECFDNLSHITSIDTFNIDTSSVTSYDNFLNCCSNISNIDLSNIDTSNATHLGGMFAQCPLFTSLDLSNFDTSKVNTCQYMFYMCSGLVSLNLNNWDLSLNTYYNTWMFQGCNSLTDVYINNSVTLNKLTNNLSSQGGAYIPSSATIHYNSTDYKWQNNAWTQQIQ